MKLNGTTNSQLANQLGSAPAPGAVSRALAGNSGRAGLSVALLPESRATGEARGRASQRPGRACSPSLIVALALAAGLFATGCTTPHHAPPPTSKIQQSALTPSQALEKLEAGNARLVAGKLQARDWPQQRAQTAAAQYPFAVVGHSHCGAVKGACSGAQLGNLTGLLDKIQPSVTEAKAKLPGGAATDGKFIEEVAESNVHHVMQQIREQSPVLRALIDSGNVGIGGGIYDLDSGKVQFFNH